MVDPRSPGNLTFFCGKMGAGKSTLARRIAADAGAVLISEDEWLAALYPGAIATLADYVDRSKRLKSPMKTLVRSILAAGTDVVMDFPANTVRQRAWFGDILSGTGAGHVLIHLDLPDETCLARIERRRREQSGRAATDTPEMFEQVTRHFVPPGPEEGFRVDVVDQPPGTKDVG